jgi:hypothetical protein
VENTDHVQASIRAPLEPRVIRSVIASLSVALLATACDDYDDDTDYDPVEPTPPAAT